MAKSDQQNTRSTANNFGSQAQGAANSNINGGGAFGSGGLSGSLSTATGDAKNSFNLAQGGFQQQQSTGGYDSNMLNTIRGNNAGIATTGGYDPNAVAGLQQQYSSMTPTGGFDPNSLNTINSGAGGIASTGGYDPGNLATISGGYTSLAGGGFTPQQEQDFRNRATESVSSTYQVLQDQAQRARSATGGLGTGGDFSKMAREMSEQSAQANLNAEVGLQGAETANKSTGLAGLSSVNANLASNKLSGLGILSSTAANEAAGSRDLLGQQANLQTNQAAGIRAGVGQQTALEGSVASGVDAANTGLAALYNSTNNQITALGQQILGQMGLASSDQQTQIAALTQLSNTPGVFDNILRAGQVAGGVLTGVGAARNP